MKNAFTDKMSQAADLIRASDYAEHADELIELLIPKIGFTSYPWIEKYLPPGHSRFGGPVDLPEGMSRPQVDGRPLPLLAQLSFGTLLKDCEGTPAQHLPIEGWLCLFLDISDLTSGEVGKEPGAAALQFTGTPESLHRDSPEVPDSANIWTACHAVGVYPADYFVSMPDADSLDIPTDLADRLAEDDDEYDAFGDVLCSNIDDLARTRHEVTLLGSPTLFNPDPREDYDDPDEWMLLLEFDGKCSWIAGATIPRDDFLDQPEFPGGADFLQYYVRKTDYKQGRLDRGRFEWMMT